MSRSKGFLLPPQPYPDDNICLAVEIPNSPEFIRAFWGMYERLGYWFMWERDPLRQGKDAAARWRDAVDETHINWERWGDLCALEINVNCGCCGDGIGISYPPFDDVSPTPSEVSEWMGLPVGQVDDGVNPPPGFVSYEEFQEYKCQASLRAAEDFFDSVNNLAALAAAGAAAGAAGLVSVVTGGAVARMIVGFLAPIIGMTLAVATVVAALISLLTYSLSLAVQLGQVFANLDIEELTCIFYNAPDAATARSEVLAQVDNQIAALALGDPDDVDNLSDAATTIVVNLLSDNALAAMFASWSYVANQPPGDCSACEPSLGFTVVQGTYMGTDEAGNHMVAPLHFDQNCNQEEPPICYCNYQAEILFDTPVTLELFSTQVELINTIYNGYPYRAYDSGGSLAIAATTQASVNAALPEADISRLLAINVHRSSSHPGDFEMLFFRFS